MCKTGLCSSRSSVSASSDYQRSKFSLSEATKICHLHYDKYIVKLGRRRAPHQRNTRYNGTIQAIFEQCLVDVRSTGIASVSYGNETILVDPGCFVFVS